MESKQQEKKNPWRFLFLVLAVYGALKILGGLGVNILHWGIRFKSILQETTAASIGIIGGADGPTAIFVTAPAWASYVLPAVSLVVGIFGYIRLRTKKKES